MAFRRGADERLDVLQAMFIESAVQERPGGDIEFFAKILNGGL